FSSRRRHTRFSRDWSSDVCSSDLKIKQIALSALGMAVIATGFVACSSDDSTTSTEENKENQMSVNSVNGNSMAYHDFYLSNGDRSEERRVGKVLIRHVARKV